MLSKNSRIKIFKTIPFLFLILVGGACLRLYGIDFGLPDLLNVDEPFEINRALRLATGSFDFSRAGKGGLYYIIFIELVLSFFVLYLTGLTKSPNEFAYFFVSHDDIFYLMARITSALIGIISLYLIYRIGCKNGGKTVGLMAMFLLAISGLNVTHAHFATVDITLVFLLLLTWSYLFAIAEGGKKKDFYLAGLFGGLSVITKLPGIVIIAPMVVVYFMHRRLSFPSTGESHRYFAMMIIIFFLVMFAGEPGYIRTFQNTQGTIKSLYGKSAKNLEEDNGPKDLLRKPSSINLHRFYSKVIIKDIGVTFLLIFIVSLLYFLFNRSLVEILVLSFSIPYFIAICSTSSILYYERYVLPLIPLIILVTSRGVGKSIEYLQAKLNRLSSLRVNAIVLFVLVLLCSPNLLSAVEATSKFRQEHPRIQAKKWVQKNIPSETRILMEGSPEHRSQSLIPLLNTKANIKEMISDLKKRDPGKALYWELRSRYLDKLDVPRYDLLLIQNDHPWIEYEEFKATDIEYVIFDVKSINQNYRKRTDHVRSTRIAFYDQLVIDPEVTEITKLGDRIEIFGKKTADGKTDAL